jgi:hypothetical protein
MWQQVATSGIHVATSGIHVATSGIHVADLLVASAIAFRFAPRRPNYYNPDQSFYLTFVEKLL